MRTSPEKHVVVFSSRKQKTIIVMFLSLSFRWLQGSRWISVRRNISSVRCRDYLANTLTKDLIKAKLSCNPCKSDSVRYFSLFQYLANVYVKLFFSRLIPPIAEKTRDVKELCSTSNTLWLIVICWILDIFFSFLLMSFETFEGVKVAYLLANGKNPNIKKCFLTRYERTSIGRLQCYIMTDLTKLLSLPPCELHCDVTRSLLSCKIERGQLWNWCNIHMLLEVLLASNHIEALQDHKNKLLWVCIVFLTDWQCS